MRCRHQPSRWRETEYLLHEILSAVNPNLPLAHTLLHWNQIAQRLASAPRNRPLQALS